MILNFRRVCFEFKLLVVIMIMLTGCTIYSEKSIPDLYPYAQKPILFLKGTAPSGVSYVFWEKLGLELEQILTGNQWYGPIIGISEQQNLWANDQQLRLEQQQFSTTFSLTGISERSLSNRLMFSMEVRQVILFQFLTLPCSEDCTSTESWLMRLQMIDLKNGQKIHRIRVTYKPSKDEIFGVTREEVAREKTLELARRFNESFVIPWHRLRYENLKFLESVD